MQARRLRGLAIARLRLEGSPDRSLDRRARAEALAEGLIELRRIVERGVLA